MLITFGVIASYADNFWQSSNNRKIELYSKTIIGASKNGCNLPTHEVWSYNFYDRTYHEQGNQSMGTFFFTCLHAKVKFIKKN